MKSSGVHSSKVNIVINTIVGIAKGSKEPNNALHTGRHE